MLSRLQYISQGKSAEEQLHNIRLALDAGCQWIQLRFKACEVDKLIELAAEVKTYCADYKALFIINDHPDIVVEVDADGVHLGLDDMPVSYARKKLGDKKIIGGTANTLQDVFQRVNEQCDYVGVGPYRFTSTKEKLSPILGLDGYRSIMSSLVAHDIQTPVYAIGGIVAEDIDALMACGIYGVAVSGMITQHENKPELIQILNQKLYATS